MIPVDDRIEAAIAVLPYIPSELMVKQAGRITGWLYPQLEIWSYGWCRQSGDSTFTHREDLVQVAALAIMEVLTEYSTGRGHKAVERWMPYLNRIGQHSARGWMKSSAVQPLSGLTSHERRIARIPHSLSQLRNKLGHEPTAQELVEFHNQIMHRRQANPRRHGSLISIADAQAILRR